MKIDNNKAGVKPDHKTNEDYNQQEPKRITPTAKGDEQQTPVYKEEHKNSTTPRNKKNAKVIVNEEKPLETKQGDSDAELAEKEAQNQGEQKDTD